MKNLRIRSVKDIEQAVWVVYHYLPYPSTQTTHQLTRLFPYLTILVAAYLLAIATLPFVFKDFPLDPLVNTGLYNFNILLSRLLFALMGGIIIVSFEKLSQRSLVGWYNMFYITLFHVFLVLVIFNPYSFTMLLIAWYLLFAIKPQFK